MTAKAKKGIIIAVSVVLIIAIAAVTVFFTVLRGDIEQVPTDNRSALETPPDFSSTIEQTKAEEYDATVSAYNLAVAAAAAQNGDLEPGAEGYVHPYNFLETDDQEALKAAVLELYQLAYNNKLNTPNLIISSRGSGGAQIKKSNGEGGITGNMTVNSYSIKNTIDDTVRTYYENAGRVTSGSDTSLLGAARLILDQHCREYSIMSESTPLTIYQQKATGSATKGPDVSIDTFPYFQLKTDAKIDVLKYNEEQWLEYNNINQDIGELSAFNLSVEALTDCSIEKITLENGESYYKVSYSLLIPDDIKNADSIASLQSIDKTTAEYKAYEDVVKFARAGVRVSASAPNLEYNMYKAELEIWENGYIRSFGSQESWKADMKISILNLFGVTSSESTGLYYYSWESAYEAEIKHNVTYSGADFTTADTFITSRIESDNFVGKSTDSGYVTKAS